MLVAKLRSDSEFLQGCKQFQMDGGLLTAPRASNTRVAEAVDHLIHAIVY